MTAPPATAAAATARRRQEPLRRPETRWVQADTPSASAVERLGRELLIPDPVCRLLVARGYGEPESAKRFLRPRLEHLEAPECLADMARAVARIADAVNSGETILVHGDYDVDGMSSVALLVRVLSAVGARHVVPFVPNRLRDGYDLGPAGVAKALEVGATLVVTCDCGTSAHAPVASLQQAGIDVIITDHHLPGGPLPPAYAVCNPRRPDCPSTDKDLAAVGVVYKLACALCDTLGVSRNIAHHQLDLVALATIADVAPLRGENRVLVRYGLKLMAESAKPGVRSLIRSAGLEGKPLTAGRVGYVLAPRLNAAGRIGDAALGLALLLAEREDESNRIARELEELNRARQELDRLVLDDALRQLDEPHVRDRWAYVLSRQGWHAGVIGIVASRIVEETARPAMLVAVDGEVGKGSGRSISAFDLHAALGQCRDLFQRFGGHRAAAGVTMAAAHLPRFADRFDEVARRFLAEDDLVPELRVDLEMPLDAVGADLENVLRHFEPFGIGNPAPVFSAKQVQLAAPPRKVGSDGLRVLFSTATATIDGIGWGMASRAAQLDVSRALDLAFRIERDEYRGVSRLQLRLADFRCP